MIKPLPLADPAHRAAVFLSRLAGGAIASVFVRSRTPSGESGRTLRFPHSWEIPQAALFS